MHTDRAGLSFSRFHIASTRKAMSTPNIVSLNGLELYGLDVKDPGLCVDLATAAEPDPHGTERKESPNTAAVFEVDTSLIALCPPLPVVASSSGSGGSSLGAGDDLDEGDERTLAESPSKRPKLSSAALLARFLRPGETFSLIGNHPNARGDDFASSQSISKQLPPIFKDAFGFDDAACNLLIENAVSYDVNASGDNTVEHVRYDAAHFLLELFEANGTTRALGIGSCIDHLEQLRCRYDLANQSNKSNIPKNAIPFFGKNITQTTTVKVDNRKGHSDRVVTVTGAHMRPETYAGTNLCVFEFIQGGLYDAAKCLKRVPVAIAGHANGVEGGLAAYLRGNLVKLVRALASDEAIATITKDKVARIDVTALKRYIARNKPTKGAISLKEKKKHEPARKTP